MSSRGRGGRFMRPRRQENEEREITADEELAESLGKDSNRRREKGSKPTRLHVSNIPMTMSEFSLRQLFSDYGNPTIFLNTSSQGNRNKFWGYIDFPSFYEADLALRTLNKKQPHNLYLKFATNIGDESNEMDEFQKEIVPCEEEPEMIRGKGRGTLMPIVGRAPSSYRPRNPPYENYGNPEEERETSYSNHNFRHERTPAHLNDTNEIYGMQAKVVQGNRSAVMGRGSYKNDKVENYSVTKINSKVEDKIHNYMNEVVYNPKEQIRNFQSDNLPFLTENCPNCSRPSSFICCNCKQWYCCQECVREHVQKTGNGCPAKNIVFEDADEKETLLDKKFYENHGRNQRSGGENNDEQIRDDNEQKDYKDYNRKSTSRNDRMSNGSDVRTAGIPSLMRDDWKAGNYRNARNSGSRGSNTFDDDDDGNLQSKQTMAKNRRSNDRPYRPGGNGNTNSNSGKYGNQGNKSFGNQNRQDRRSFGSNRNSQHENDVYVRNEEINATAGGISRMSLDPTDKNDVNVEETLAVFSGTQQEVVISSNTEEENLYWVQMKSSLKDLLDMITSLNNVNKSSKIVQVSANGVYAAPFKDEWYRARVLSVSDRSASVRFIDFGNESEIKLEDFRFIARELVTKPALAFKIRIRGSPVKLEEGTELVIKINNKDFSGAWEVSLVGDVDVAPEEYSISYDHFELVHIMDGSNGEYHVQLDCNVVKLTKMCEALGKHSSIKVEPVLGELYVKRFSDTWCRAKVIEERPLTIFYIDYGNSEVVDKNDLHPLPVQFKNVSGMAIKVKLAEGTSSKYFRMNFSESLYIKAVDKLKDGTFVVHVKGEKYPMSKDNSAYPKGVYSDKERTSKHIIELIKNSEKGVWVNVQKVMSCECLTGFLVLNTTSPDYCSTSDLSSLLRTVKPSGDYKPKVQDLVIARVGTTWCRAYVMLITEEEISVALIDYGKVISVKERNLMLLPTRYALQARQAVRVILNTELEKLSGMIGEKVHLTDVQKVDEILKCTFGEYGVAEIIPWTPLIEEAGLRVFPLKNDTDVVLSAFHSPKSVYLRSSSKDDTRKFMELLEDVNNYSKKAEPLRRKPLCGEFVCAQYKDDGRYYRAQIFKKDKEDHDSYKVTFVDFGNIESVNIALLQLLPDTFKKVPCFAVKAGLKDLVAPVFNPAAMKYLNNLTVDQIVLLLTYEDHLGDVTLTDKSGKVINTELIELMEHSIRTLETPANDHVKMFQPFMGEDLTYEKWPMHSRLQLVVVQVDNHKTVMALNSSSKLIPHLCNYLTPKINSFCEGHSQRSYNPRTNEMVLAKYRDDDGKTDWYRAVCIKAMTSSSVVLFVDYGNCGEEPHSDIRCMPAEFMDTPAAVKRCTLYGVSDSLSNDTKYRLKKFLETFHGEAVVLEDCKDVLGCTTVWIPSLYPELEKLGLSPVEPPPGI